MIHSSFYESQQIKMALSLESDAAKLGAELASLLKGGCATSDETANAAFRRTLEAEREARLRRASEEGAAAE